MIRLKRLILEAKDEWLAVADIRNPKSRRIVHSGTKSDVASFIRSQSQGVGGYRNLTMISKEDYYHVPAEVDTKSMEALHNGIVALLKRNKNIEDLKTYGPEESRYVSGTYNSEYSFKYDVKGAWNYNGARFSLEFRKDGKITMFIPDEGYFEFTDKATPQKILSTAKKYIEVLK